MRAAFSPAALDPPAKGSLLTSPGPSCKGQPSHQQPWTLLQRAAFSPALDPPQDAGFFNRFPREFVYLDLNSGDRCPDPFPAVERAVAFARTAHEHGSRLLWHGERGVNRSATMAMACLMAWPSGDDGGACALQQTHSLVMDAKPALRAGGGLRPEFLEALSRSLSLHRPDTRLPFEVWRRRRST